MITPQTAATRALAVSMAAGHDINEELTIILGRTTDPEITAAALRAAWKILGLLLYAKRRGGQAVNVPMEKLIVEDVGAPFLADAEIRETRK